MTDTTTPTRWRKRPVVIDAWRIDPAAPQPEWVAEAFVDWGKVERFVVGDISWRLAGDGLDIGTLEGTMFGEMGAWLIRGVKGELYACAADIFAATYEPAEG